MTDDGTSLWSWFDRSSGKLVRSSGLETNQDVIHRELKAGNMEVIRRVGALHSERMRWLEGIIYELQGEGADWDYARGIGIDVVASTANTVSTPNNAISFTVRTYRQHDRGDTIAIECVGEDGTSTRLVLPPKVTARLAVQLADVERLDRIETPIKARKKLARRLATERKERGEVPGFLRHRVKA